MLSTTAPFPFLGGGAVAALTAEPRGADQIAALTARMSRRTLLIGLMVAFTVGNLATVLAPWVLPLLFGADFDAAVPLLQIQAWALPGLAVASFVATAYIFRAFATWTRRSRPMSARMSSSATTPATSPRYACFIVIAFSAGR